MNYYQNVDIDNKLYCMQLILMHILIVLFVWSWYWCCYSSVCVNLWDFLHTLNDLQINLMNEFCDYVWLLYCRLSCMCVSLKWWDFLSSLWLNCLQVLVVCSHWSSWDEYKKGLCFFKVCNIFFSHFCW